MKKLQLTPQQRRLHLVLAVAVVLTATILGAHAALVLAGKASPGLLFTALSPSLFLFLFSISAVLGIGYIVVLVRANAEGAT